MPLFCCHTRNSVLPGLSSQRNTRFDRKDRDRKSAFPSVNESAPSVTSKERFPSTSTTSLIVVPSVPYSLRSKL